MRRLSGPTLKRATGGPFHGLSRGTSVACLATLARSLEPRGHVILATSGWPDPLHGLPSPAYSADAIAPAIGARAELVSWRLEDHRTPPSCS